MRFFFFFINLLFFACICFSSCWSKSDSLNLLLLFFGNITNTTIVIAIVATACPWWCIWNVTYGKVIDLISIIFCFNSWICICEMSFINIMSTAYFSSFSLLHILWMCYFHFRLSLYWLIIFGCGYSTTATFAFLSSTTIIVVIFLCF